MNDSSHNYENEELLWITVLKSHKISLITWLLRIVIHRQNDGRLTVSDWHKTLTSAIMEPRKGVPDYGNEVYRRTTEYH